MTAKLDPAESVDHRTRVGLERRRKMRLRLIESAFVVFSEKSVDLSQIDDVIAQAGVARGTFYNYFRTNEELLSAVGETLSNELISLIEETVGEIEDPVEILATGLRLFLRTARMYPKYARFMWRAGLNANSAGHLVYTYLPKHILGCVQRGDFKVKDPVITLELLLGMMLAAMHAMSTLSVANDMPEEAVRHALMAFGVAEARISTLIALPLPEISLPRDSLLVKTAGQD
ncbi:TetR/AcrR family transcriptional regulator [Alcanivorax sp.]|jgi:AcrR family transcriptional regulator|uniref:TetR/AcrR family transcriptional regulator n=1 Tax=Alcanivorax sp. TaxID=1872427 RepID=UPI0032D93BA2